MKEIHSGIISSNVSFKEFQSGKCGFGKATLYSYWPPMSTWGHAINWQPVLSVCLHSAQCMLWQAPAPLLWPQMGLSVCRKWKNECQLQCGQLALKLTINWPIDKLSWLNRNHTHSRSLCLSEAPVEHSYESYYLHGPWGSGDPITGNTKWQEIISVYSGV